MPKKLLENRADLEFLLSRFYARVRDDDLIGPIFNDIAQVDWHHHIPKIVDFWESLFFGGTAYQGRPFPPHMPLGLRVEHFQRWLGLFDKTIDESFEGFKAEELKKRAQLIGANFLHKLRLLESEE